MEDLDHHIHIIIQIVTLEKEMKEKENEVLKK